MTDDTNGATDAKHRADQDARATRIAEFVDARRATRAPLPDAMPPQSRDDTARLDWLDANPNRVSVFVGASPHPWGYCDADGAWFAADSLRAAIDAAMQPPRAAALDPMARGADEPPCAVCGASADAHPYIPEHQDHACPESSVLALTFYTPRAAAPAPEVGA